MNIETKDGTISLTPETAIDHQLIDFICLGLNAYANKINDSVKHSQCHSALNRSGKSDD